MSVAPSREASEAAPPAGGGRTQAASLLRRAARAGFSLQLDELVFLGLVGAVFSVVLSVSYLDEDAFISFRVVDNFVHGYGLRWNVDERVQVFTNSLWVLALIPLYAVLPSIAAASYLLSAAASTLAVGVVAWPLRGKPLSMVLGLLLPLLLSQAFTDYTSSGLENPFIFLFVALFARALDRGATQVPWRTLCLCAALSAVTRADTVLLFVPALAWLWLSDLKRARYGQIALGASPLLAWLAFALFYYGAIFPNTKYAKLNAAVPHAQYRELGVSYLVDIARNDTVTFGVLVAGSVAAALWTQRLLRRRAAPVEPRWAAFLWGAPLYSLYVFYIGGDFMAGRHWAAPFFLVVVTLVLALRDCARANEPHALALACSALLAARFGVQSMTMQRDTLKKREQDRYAVVRDGEIRYQRYNCSFYEALFGSRGPASEHSWSQAGLKERERAAELAKSQPGLRHVVIQGAAGKRPFHAGPNVHYIDPLGITDPLLARLPDRDGKLVFSGHLTRLVPRGYVEARATGSLAQMDPKLAAYFAELRHVISGPLFEGARLLEIVAFNRGDYDVLLAEYLKGGYLKDEGEPELAR